MSADNLVYIKRFDQNDFRYVELSASIDVGDLSSIPNNRFGITSYATPIEATKAAIDDIKLIEYGFYYSDDCFVTE